MSVLVWGVPSESPVALLLAALERRGADAVVVHSGRPGGTDLRLHADDAAPLAGVLTVDGRAVAVEALTGAYVRPVEPEIVPGLAGRPAGDPARHHAGLVYRALSAWAEAAGPLTGAHVANPLSAMASNTSKPYQAQVIVGHGFGTPRTLVTDDPDEARAFAADVGEAVYKSTSGVRSIVTAFDPVADAPRLDRLRWCPVQFQERVRGRDVRVHVVGDRALAAIVTSEAVDYRYSRAQTGADARLEPYELDDDLAARCVALATDL
ncbi:MAG TPA: hypothetical protein VGC04_08265, partial [Cellulomonas sp.]